MKEKQTTKSWENPWQHFLEQVVMEMMFPEPNFLQGIKIGCENDYAVVDNTWEQI